MCVKIWKYVVNMQTQYGLGVILVLIRSTIRKSADYAHRQN